MRVIELWISRESFFKKKRNELVCCRVLREPNKKNENELKAIVKIHFSEFEKLEKFYNKHQQAKLDNEKVFQLFKPNQFFEQL